LDEKSDPVQWTERPTTALVGPDPLVTSSKPIWYSIMKYWGQYLDYEHLKNNTTYQTSWYEDVVGYLQYPLPVSCPKC